MINRYLQSKLLALSKQFPVISVIGPRQSGKTTLVKAVFPKYQYISFEDIDTRRRALADIRGFLELYGSGVILDEVQRVPELFSYLQTHVDASGKKGKFILTGSHNYLLQEKVSQSLAGRVAMLRLLPFSMQELSTANKLPTDINKLLFKGFYPRLYGSRISPVDWYPSYIETYMQRDVREIKNIPNLNYFQKFLHLLAGRHGQQLNLSALGAEVGVVHNTIASWISVLEASYIIYLLKPHFNNFNKRVTKTPKIYFYDSGLVCSLLGIEKPEQLATHHIKGALFEGLIVTELIKARFNNGLPNNCYYWRDKTGNEVDCIVDKAGSLIPIEIKSGKTINTDYFSNLNYWKSISNNKEKGFVVYGGEVKQKVQDNVIIPWKNAFEII
jgi:uncharacterized protein